MNKTQDLTIDREKRVTLLNWLRAGIINGAELEELYNQVKGVRTLSMEEARAFLKQLEEEF